MPKGASTSGLWKITCLSGLCWLEDLSCLSRILLQWWVQLWDNWCWMLSTSWLSLSIFNSSMWVASNTPLVSLYGLSEGFIVWVVSSPRTWIGILVGGWAMGWPWQPSIGPPPAWQCLLVSASGSSEKTGCLGWPLSSVGGFKVVGKATFLVNIFLGRGPRSPSERFGTPQVVWWVCLLLGSTLAGHANGLGGQTFLLPSAPTQQHAGTYCGG